VAGSKKFYQGQSMDFTSYDEKIPGAGFDFLCRIHNHVVGQPVQETELIVFAISTLTQQPSLKERILGFTSPKH
jgi:hypothetical protein